MDKRKKLLIDVVLEHSRQVNQLLEMGANTTDRKKFNQYTAITRKITESLNNIHKMESELRTCNFEVMKMKLKPCISLLESTRAEIERLQK